MMDTHQTRQIVEKALANAQKAGLGATAQTEHAVRALLQLRPEMSETDAIKAVLRIERPYESGRS